jgi:3D (Asp-Asp-Asp) domain-containing protein
LRAVLYVFILAVVVLATLGRVTPAIAESELRAGQAAVVAGTGGQGLRVRAGPSTGHRIVSTINAGTIVRIVAGPISDGVNAWYRISFGTSTSGWSIGRYLAPSIVGRAASSVQRPRTFLTSVTAYSNGIGGVPPEARTYSGTHARWGVVAVDPKVIPIGSLLLIEGHAGTTFVAEDTGGGIKGHAIDIWLPDPVAARRYGIKYRRVTIIREGPAR